MPTTQQRIPEQIGQTSLGNSDAPPNHQPEKPEKPERRIERRKVPSGQEMWTYTKATQDLSDRLEQGDVDYLSTLETLHGLKMGKKYSVFSLVPKPEAQIAMAKMLNAVRGWGIPEGKFDRLSQPANTPLEASCYDHLSPTQALVLNISLDHPDMTIAEAFRLIRGGQPRYCADLPVENLANLVLFHGKVPKLHTLEWQLIDFGANNSRCSVTDVRSKAQGPLPETAILWAAIYNPRIFQELIELGVSHVCIGGFSVLVNDEMWTPVTHYDSASRTLQHGHGILGAKPAGYSIPEFITETKGENGK